MASTRAPSLSLTEAFPAFGRHASAATAAEARGARSRRRPQSGLRRALLGVLMVLVLAMGYFAGGFIRFTQEVAALATPQRVAPADGIVVLTGGALRVDQAVGLLKEGRAKRLLISGVNRNTSVGALSKLTETDRRWFDCCVDLDYDALNTIGNAEMTDQWARRQGFDALILVTSDYHMPRTLMEFERFAHVAVIRPYPVARADLWVAGAMPSGLGLKVLLTEYVKLLAARLRLAAGMEVPVAWSRDAAGADRAS
ncbi:YdcF family protein [Aureimonas glaciei]|uniref:DUF218 domain-containing protein n=1 Tax=Aureimonas glaciei TaxID=1776957 RepID=A0A916Y6H0_9HYPH|nr:YdcF family protein [Aureimonas glaciei]GGD32582.1 hypothetical protein GCM10011335_39490 [Aureimonas glaciei]